MALTDIKAMCETHAHRHEIHDLGRKLATALEIMDRAQGTTPGEQGPGK